jgi:hypothetical protein
MTYLNPEDKKESDRKYREANPERKREHDRKWREANLGKEREKNRERMRKWAELPGQGQGMQ